MDVDEIKHVEVRRLNGDTVCVIEDASPQWRGEDLKLLISNGSGVCVYRMQLTAGEYRVRLGTPMARILKWIWPDGIIYMIETEILAAGPDFCLKHVACQPCFVESSP